MDRVARLRLALSLAALTTLASGCAPNTGALVAPSDPGSPAFLRVPAGAAQPFGSSTSSSVSKDLDGTKGGTFRNGRFTLVVPPGAYSGKATLTILVPDASVMECQLSITPADANRFLVPVQLVADWSGATNVDVASLETLWYDEATLVWVSMPGSVVSIGSSTITTPLPHFSTYGVTDGKAGW